MKKVAIVSKALLIIDVQISSVTKPEIAAKIEKIQYDYKHVFVSRFINKASPLIPLTGWNGYDNETLAFVPAPFAVVFDKNIYSSFIEELKDFNEVHLCGFDTDACIYKTAMDLIENNIRPVILTALCASADEDLHQAGLTLLKRNIGAENLI